MKIIALIPAREGSKRLRKSDSLLTKHPFYNFGRKDGHV